MKENKRNLRKYKFLKKKRYEIEQNKFFLRKAKWNQKEKTVCDGKRNETKRNTFFKDKNERK